MRYNRPILEIDRPNANGRIYPLGEVEKLVEDFNSKHAEKAFICSPFPRDNETTSFAKYAETYPTHFVTMLMIEGDNLLADIETVDSPRGEKLAEALDRSPGIHFRINALGRVTYREGSPYGWVSEIEIQNIFPDAKELAEYLTSDYKLRG